MGALVGFFVGTTGEDVICVGALVGTVGDPLVGLEVIAFGKHTAGSDLAQIPHC